MLLRGRKAPAGTASLVGEAGVLAVSLEETLDMEDLRSDGTWTLERKECEVASGGVKGEVLAPAVADFLVGVLRERKLEGKGMW